ncbi:MAG: molybdopterin molybdotransferase MoeA [Thermoanaerobaculia bacterium]
MIRPEAAWNALESDLAPLPGTRLARRELLGRVLLEPLHATIDVPPLDVSAMDGYAIAGTAEAGSAFPVVGTVAAGDPPGVRLASGQACRIMTGAPLPSGADRVVPVEQTDDGDESVRCSAAVPPGANIRRGGEVARRGDLLLPAGTPLTPAGLAALATHGHDSATVHRPPRVAILTTGNEVVPPDREPGPGRLRDSHTDFLLAGLATCRLEGESLGIAPDDPETLRRAASAGLERDVLLLCGGVSKGRFDHVAGLLDGLGCTPLFHGVAIQPGKPLLAARHDGGWLFGLPGNPNSVMACFWLFVRPLLRRLEGHEDGYWQGALTGRLAEAAPGAKGRDRFLPARHRIEEGELVVAPLAARGSHDLHAFATATALLRIPAGSPPAAAGAACSVLPLPS